MADDLERLVRSIEGEGPSPDFVTTLRERIVAESPTPAVDDDRPVLEIDLRQTGRETHMTTRWKLIGLAAAVLIALLVFFTVRDSDRLDTVGSEGDSTTTTVTPTTEPPSGESAPFVSDATPLNTEGSELEPGEYRVDTVGTPFSFTLDQPMTAQFNREGFLQLSLAPPGQWGGPDDEDINFLRPATLADPTQPTEVPQGPDDGWPADDFTGWLENLGRGIVVSDVEETTLGGLDAVRVDLELGDIECPSGGPFCVILATDFVSQMALNPGSTYRMWMVDQGAEAPLLVVVGVDRKEDIEWLDTAEAILSTLSFGDVAPSPIQRPPAGSIELPLLGGIRLDLPQNSTVVPGLVPELGSIRFDGSPGWMQFFVNPSDLSGSPLESADLEARLLAAGGEVAEVDSTSADGIEASVLDFTGTSQSVAVTWGPDSAVESGFDGFLGMRNRIWLIDNPERGLLVVTAEVFEDDDEVFSVMVANAEAVVDSLEFIDLE